MFAKLLEVFKYLRTNLLVDNDGWMVLLGRVIWPELAEAITANCLRKVIFVFICQNAFHQCKYYRMDILYSLWTSFLV